MHGQAGCGLWPNWAGLQSNLIKKLVVINGVIVSLTGMSHRGPRLTEIEVGEGMEGGVPP